jgi:dTDP-4-amino-4,6-dideoxygalactose transaminase
LFCGSGSAALLAAYFGLDLDPRAEVLVPTNTYPTTVTPLLLLNLRPVLCDSDPATGNIDLGDAKRRLTSRTQAIAVTHMWGHPAALDELAAFASSHALAVVEDCSHAHGATSGGEPVGSVGDAAVYSVGARKLVSGGAGGVLITRSESIRARALVLGHPPGRTRGNVGAMLEPYVTAGFGLNLRATPLAAVLALDHLDRLPATIEIKNRNLALLNVALERAAPWMRPPTRTSAFESGTWYGYRCTGTLDPATLDLLAAELQQRGVPVSRSSILLHRERLFSNASPLRTHEAADISMCDPETYPVSDQMARHCLAVGTERLYEPAEDLIAAWEVAFREVNPL